MKTNNFILLTFCLFISFFAISQNKEREEKAYYKNGKLQHIGNYINNLQTGEWKFYHENGELNCLGLFVNGQKKGEWKYYHENGKLKEFGVMIDNEASGVWKSYYDNGILESEGKYIDGIEAGQWKFYDKTGKLEETIKYFDGKQSENIPPIQKYLDKVVNIDQFTSPTKVSQKITVNTFISTLKSKDISWKEVYSNIKWNELSRYKFNEYKDFIEIEFIFYKTINLEIVDEEFGKENKKVESFICKVWPKDKTEVLDILEDWFEKGGF